jgi:probable HAF family extracellular repeat protein
VRLVDACGRTIPRRAGSSGRTASSSRSARSAASYSAAFGLNDQDQVVGASTREDGTQVAFLWSNDQMVDLNTLLPVGKRLVARLGHRHR